MAVTAAVAAVVTAAASVTFGVTNYQAQHSAAEHAKAAEQDAQRKLDEQQRAAASEAAREAKTGSVFGFGDPDTAGAMRTGLGFGTARPGDPNSGRAQITGMG